MNTLAKVIVPALAVFGLAGTAVTPALAAESQPNRIWVSYNDLDLATVAGQKTLDRRIERAARDVCDATTPRTGTRIMDRDAQACLARARTEAKQQVAVALKNEQRGG